MLSIRILSFFSTTTYMYMFSSAKKGTMKGRGKRGKREERSERARGKGKKKGGEGLFSSAKKGTMKGRAKRGKREEKSERARGKGKKKEGEGEEKEIKWKKYR